MAASTSPVRQVLEPRFSQLLAELEGVVDSEVGSQVAKQVEGRLDLAAAQAAAESKRRSRSELASQLNQAVRRLRQASDAESLGATLLDVASPFSRGAAILRVYDSAVKGERVRGVPEEAAEAFCGLEIRLEDAPALAEAIRSLDQVIAEAAPDQISAEASGLAAHKGDGRVSIFPLVANGRAEALLFAWGAPEAAALETLAQVAASCWAALPGAVPSVHAGVNSDSSVESLRQPDSRPAGEASWIGANPAAALVNIAIPENGLAERRPRNGSGWDALSLEEQQTHLRAQRFARVQVAEMQLFEAEAVQEGRIQRDLYGALRKPIDAARMNFRESFFASCPSMVDYLHLELAQTLAHDETELLGNDYPGPMV